MRVAATLAVASGIGAAAVALAGATPASADQISDARAQAAAISAKISANDARIAALTGQVTAADYRLSQIQSQIDATRAQIAKDQADVARNQRQLRHQAIADRKSTRLNSSHVSESRMPSSA